MMLRPYCNLVAIWQPDLGLREAATHRLNRVQGLILVPSSYGWIVGIKPLPHTTWQQVFSPGYGVAVPEGAEGLIGPDQADAAPWTMVRDDLDSGTGACARATTRDFLALHFGPQGESRIIQTHASLMPVHWAQDRAGIILGTCLDLIAAARSDPPQPDRAIAALWASGRPFFTGRSILRGVGELPRGARSLLDPTRPPRIQAANDELLGVEQSRRSLSRDEVGAALREVVLCELRTGLATTGTNLLALSCGRDSSTLAWLVNRTLGLPLSTASLLPCDPTVRAGELAIPASALEGIPEARRIVLDWAHRDYPADVLFKGPDIIGPVLHPMLCELNVLRQHHSIDVYFGGEGCDELIGGEGVLAEWLADVGVWHALKRMPILTQSGRITHKAVLKARFPGAYARWNWFRHRPKHPALPVIFSEDLCREVSQLRKNPSGRSTNPSQHMIGRHQRGFTLCLNMNWAACSHYGIRRLFPLVNRGVLSLLWTTAAAHRLHPRTKELFSSAFRGSVPASMLDRPDKGFWGAAVPAPPFEELREAGGQEDRWELFARHAPLAADPSGSLQRRIGFLLPRRVESSVKR